MTTTEPSTDYVELPVHERPLVHELAEWRTFIPFAGRVLALQGSHETVAKGIYDHSTAFVDPIGRGLRTMEYAQRMLFGSDRASTAAEIRELHHDIKGTGFDGRPYHAWNREAWTWVHLTSFEAFEYSLRVVHGKVDPASLTALYEDWRQVGMLYGVRSADMPTDVAGLHEYIRDGIETKLTHAPDLGLIRNLARPPGVNLPTALWNPLWRLGRRPLETLVFGSFPARVRERWGIRWTRTREAEHRIQLALLRTAPTPLPDRLRMLPYARQALRDAAA